MLACVDDFKGAGYCVLADGVAAGGDLPNCIAELLHESRRIVRNGDCGVERLTREIATVFREAGFEKGVEVVFCRNLFRLTVLHHAVLYHWVHSFFRDMGLDIRSSFRELHLIIRSFFRD